MTEPLVDVTGARRRRARARLRRRLTVAGIVAAVVALVGGGVWLVLGSPYLVARQVAVHGTSIVTPEQVEEAAAVPLGSPLATLDTGAVPRRVTEALPAVAEARVGRSWPSTVTIDVVERTPVVAVDLDGMFLLVAADGVGFHTTPQAPERVMVAQGNVGDDGVLIALAKVAASLPASVRDQASGISANTPDSVMLALSDGRKVVWGSAEDTELKARVLQPLLGVKAREYDVSSPTHPTTR